MFFGKDGTGHPDPEVIVTTDAGEVRVLDYLVGRALELLDREMARVGIP